MTNFIYCVHCENKPEAACFNTEADAMEFARTCSNCHVEKNEIDEDGNTINTEVIWECGDIDNMQNDEKLIDDNPFEMEFPKSDINEFPDDDYIEAGLKELEDNKLVDPYDADEFDGHEDLDTSKMVEAIEENENEVECKICFDLFPKADCIKTEDGYVCKKCNQELHSHQGTNLDLIDADPFDLEYDDPRDPEEEVEVEVKEGPVDGNEMRKHEKAIEEESLEEHVNEEHPAIESDQVLQGTDNAVVDCPVAKVIAHSEDEKPLDCKMKKPALEEPLAGKEVDIKLNENLGKDLLDSIAAKIPEDLKTRLELEVDAADEEDQKEVIGDILFNFNLKEDTIKDAKELADIVLSNIDLDKYDYQIWNPWMDVTEDCKSIDEVVDAINVAAIDPEDYEDYLEISIYPKNKKTESLTKAEIKELDEDLKNIKEELVEAKKDEEELPVDPEAVKLEVHQELNDLVADEIEAINGYDEAKADILDAPIEHKDAIIDTLDHIKDEEKEHIDELIDATTEIPFDKGHEAPVVEEPVVEPEPEVIPEEPVVEEELNEDTSIDNYIAELSDSFKGEFWYAIGNRDAYDAGECYLEVKFDFEKYLDHHEYLKFGEEAKTTGWSYRWDNTTETIYPVVLGLKTEKYIEVIYLDGEEIISREDYIKRANIPEEIFNKLFIHAKEDAIKNFVDHLDAEELLQNESLKLSKKPNINEELNEDPFDQDFPKNEEKPLVEVAAQIPFNSSAKVGDCIKIKHLNGEGTDYDGREGKIERIDDLGQLHGTWGGLAVIPGIDEYEVIVKENLKEDYDDNLRDKIISRLAGVLELNRDDEYKHDVYKDIKNFLETNIDVKISHRPRIYFDKANKTLTVDYDYAWNVFNATRPISDIRELKDIFNSLNSLYDSTINLKFESLTENKQETVDLEAKKDNKFIKAVKDLAKKAAKVWNSLSRADRKYYREEGTAMMFEDWPEEYNKILDAVNNFSLEDLKDAGINSTEPESINDDAFDYLDDMFWKYTRKGFNEDLSDNQYTKVEEWLKDQEAKFRDIKLEWDTDTDYYTISIDWNKNKNKFGAYTSVYHASEDNNAEYPEKYTDEEESYYSSLKDLCDDLTVDFGDDFKKYFEEEINDKKLLEASSAETRAYKNGGQDMQDLIQGKAIARIKDPAARDAAVAAVKAGRPEVAKQFYGQRKENQAEDAINKKHATMADAGTKDGDIIK